MYRTMLKSKSHRATVTDANIDYEGSITIDEKLLELANIVAYEQVQIYNITNGHRFETYAIKGERGSGVICLNGASARLANPGDLIIIASYVLVEEIEVKEIRPIVVQVNKKNQCRENLNISLEV
ncbi:MAG: aspartate 1-decarboxylase [bacterium]